MIGVAPTRPNAGRLLLTPVLVAVAIGVLLLYVTTTPLSFAERFNLKWNVIEPNLVRHLVLVGWSFSAAAVIGVGLGVLVAARTGPSRVFTWLAFLFANLGQAVPSVGVLALALVAFGLGIRATVLGLVVYGILPVLRNTVVGLEGVDAAALEAAHGMGMTTLQTLWRVRIPLASREIFAGLRTSVVLIVGTATLGNFVGGQGLGVVIATGLANPGHLSVPLIMTGATLVAALALLLDWALGIAERLLTPRT